MSEDTDNDDGESTVFSKSKLHLNPQAVITLAKSIPNCSRVKPPKDNDRNIKASSSTNTGGGANNNASSAAGPAARRSTSDSAPSSSYFSTESTSYFSTFSRRLHLTFSNDEKQEEEHKNQKAENEILSFIVSDTYSIEQLAAEAADEAGGKHASTSDLQGAGIARIDVYCQSGTVITCRVIPTAVNTTDAVDSSSSNNPSLRDLKNDAVGAKGDDVNDGRKLRERSSSFLQILPTPRKDNLSQTTKEDNNDNDNNNQEGTQVRRIIRRKCTMDALRRILEQPPKLPEINEFIITDYLPPNNDSTKKKKKKKKNDDDSSQGSTVSQILRKRQQKRQSKKHKKFSKFSKEQNTFLKAQQKKYEKRIRHDEKMRRHVGNAILAAGMGGMGSEMGVDLTSMHSLSLDDSTVTSSGGGNTQAGSDGKGMHSNGNINSNNNTSNDGGGGVGSGVGAAASDMSTGDAYHAQKAIQDKIEIADMGLAILMGEAQRLERIMATMRETKDKDLDTDYTDEGSKGADTDGDTTLGSAGSKHRSRRARGGNVDDDDDDDDDSRSYSTVQSTDREVGDDSTIGSRTSAGSNSSLEDSSWEERKLARLMQGCEIEYSFPHDYHDELEGALMNDDMEDNSSSDSLDEEDSNEEDDASRASSKVARRRRGRSPPKDGVSSATNASSLRKKKHKLEVSPIVAVPTNGEGCVVLRENGAFDVVGKIPAILRKKLFRSKGPMPDQIALGTLGRYYVHFVDGSFFFYGPPAMSKTLIHGNKQKQRRGKDRNRGKRGEVSVVSVAFGKKLDDFFIVRSDGSWESNGSLPAGLDGLMEDRKGRADLLWVALGANDEWCVRSKHGRVWWEGVSVEADEALADILAEDGENELKFIDFGKDDTYFLLHK